MQTVKCPHCNKAIQAPDGGGHLMTCIHCNGKYQTPDLLGTPINEVTNVNAPRQPPILPSKLSNAVNPYEAPKSPSFNVEINRRPRIKRRNRQHRGGIILTLGIVGFLTGLGIILGPMAWIMGKNDLNLMRRGMMDPSGRDMTQIGYTLGIITTIVGVITICLVAWYLYFLFGVIEEVDTQFDRAMQEAEEAVRQMNRDMERILSE